MGSGGGVQVSQHQTGLPPSIISLFEARAPLEYMPAPARPKKTLALTGIAGLVNEFEDPPKKGNDAVDEATAAAAATAAARKPVPVGLETRDARLVRITGEKKQRHEAKLRKQIKEYDPKTANAGSSADPYKTLFVGRLAYEADEKSVRDALEKFGDVRSVEIVYRKGDRDKQVNKGYAFVEFVREDDMKAAYRGANGRVIEGRAVVVDAERARTVPNWRPRRLGGGVGRGRQARQPGGGGTNKGPQGGYASAPVSGYAGAPQGGGYASALQGGGYASAPVHSGGGDRRDERGGGGGYARRDDDRRDDSRSRRDDRGDDRGDADRRGGGGYARPANDRRDDRRDRDRGYGDRDRGDRDRDRDRDRDETETENGPETVGLSASTGTGPPSGLTKIHAMTTGRNGLGATGTAPPPPRHREGEARRNHRKRVSYRVVPYAVFNNPRNGNVNRGDCRFYVQPLT